MAAHVHVQNGSVVENNSAYGGAGIDNGGTVVVAASYVEYNTSSWNGGGINNGGTIYVQNNSIVEENRAGVNGGGNGGGIASYGTCVVVGSAIDYNTAFGDGGVPTISTAEPRM